VIENLYSVTKGEIKNLCFEREEYWIKYYKDNGYSLYNMTNGGDDVLEKKFPERAVIQYDLFCNEVARFNSISEAADITGINHSDISECCLKNGKIFCTNNCIWRYTEEPLSDTEIFELNNRYKGVCQYDFDGNLLNTFYRPRDAVIYVNLNGGKVIEGNIIYCMKGKVKSAGGYIWRYRSDPFDKYPLPKLIRKVEQHALNGDLIAIYNHCVDAEKKTGIDSSCINQCCLGNAQMAGNYIWCYEGDNYNTNIKFKEKPVDRYDLYGNYIDSFSSITDASEKLNINYSSISSVCRGFNKTGGGYIWRYRNDPINTYKYDIKRGGDNVA